MSINENTLIPQYDFEIVVRDGSNNFVQTIRLPLSLSYEAIESFKWHPDIDWKEELSKILHSELNDQIGMMDALFNDFSEFVVDKHLK